MTRRRTIEEFVAQAREAHGNKYDYSKVNYVNCYTRVTIICPKHGEFTQVPDTHCRKKSGCFKCGHEGRRLTTENFIKGARKVHGDTYNYLKTDCNGTTTKLTIICPQHGPFKQLPWNHLSGRGCARCAAELHSARSRSNTEEFIQKSHAVHGDRYDYSQVEYVTKVDKVRIICKNHGEFEQIASNHLGGSGCPACGQMAAADKTRMPQEEFIARAKKIYGDRYDYSKVEYINNNTKVTIICSKHGEFHSQPSNFLGKKRVGISGGIISGCPTCSGRYTQEMFISKAIEKHGDQYDYSLVSYVDSQTEVAIICPEHGQFKIRPQDYCSSGYGCRACGIESGRQFRVKTLDQFIIDAREFHGTTYDYSKVEYVNGNTNVIIGCPEHGDFEQRPQVHIKGANCPHCARKNSTESMLREVLESMFSKFGAFKFPNTRPEWLRNPNTDRKLELDCYNKDLKLAFEFHGQQHYKPIEAWGGEREFIKIRRRDHFTRFYCKQQGVTLIEIDGRDLTRIQKNRRGAALKEAIESKLKSLREDQKQQLMKNMSRMNNECNKIF